MGTHCRSVALENCSAMYSYGKNVNSTDLYLNFYQMNFPFFFVLNSRLKPLLLNLRIHINAIAIV